MNKQFVLKDDAESGIYPGLGIADHGQPLTAYGEEQEQAFRDDSRFKLYHAPKEDAAAEPEPLAAEAEAPAVKPAKSGKEGK